MGQDLEAGPDLADDLVRSLGLSAGEPAPPDALLEAVEDGGGCQEAGRLVGEVIVEAGVADDRLRHPPELLHVDGQGEVEAGQHMVQVVQGGARAQLPAKLRKDQQLPLLENDVKSK